MRGLVLVFASVMFVVSLALGLGLGFGGGGVFRLVGVVGFLGGFFGWLFNLVLGVFSGAGSVVAVVVVALVVGGRGGGGGGRRRHRLGFAGDSHY